MVALDLRNDVPEVQGMLDDSIRKYTALHRESRTSKSHPPVTRIDLAFSLGDTESIPWVHLHLDTRPGSEPDGAPTHPDFGRLPRERWLPHYRTVSDGEEVIVVDLRGTPHVCHEEDFVHVIGGFLVSILLRARDDGRFADLPRASRCELGVEDPTTGEFGWPRYEARGQENLV